MNIEYVLFKMRVEVIFFLFGFVIFSWLEFDGVGSYFEYYYVNREDGI